MVKARWNSIQISVPFFIREEELKTKIGKIGLASAFLLGLVVNQVAANETEVKASSEESSVQTSSSKVEEKKSETTRSQKEEEKKVETSYSQSSEKQEEAKETQASSEKEEVKETRASSQKEESKPNSTLAHWEGDFYIKSDGSKAKSEWIFDATYAENETDAENDAKQTVELLKKYKMNLSYPIYYDVENWEYDNKSKKAPADTDTWVKIINKYMEDMKKAGYQNVKVYSYRQLLQTRLNHPNILKHVNWVAAYTDALDWNNPYYSGNKGWQYTSSDSLKGIRGQVDVSVWY